MSVDIKDVYVGQKLKVTSLGIKEGWSEDWADLSELSVGDVVVVREKCQSQGYTSIRIVGNTMYYLSTEYFDVIE